MRSGKKSLGVCLFLNEKAELYQEKASFTLCSPPHPQDADVKDTGDSQQMSMEA